jgi:hypothetical protein
MEMITAAWDSAEPGMPTVMVALVDEMQEDPHCRAALLGNDAHGALLVSVWDGGVAREVAAGIATDHPELVVRRLVLGADSIMLG